MDGLIEAFVEAARGASPAAERADLGQVLGTAAELLYAPARDAGMRLSRDDPGGPVAVRGDPVDVLRAALAAGLALLGRPSPGGELKLSLDAGGDGSLLLFAGGATPPDPASLALARALAARCGADLQRPDGTSGLALRFPADPADRR
jgi:hypothetical protein